MKPKIGIGIKIVAYDDQDRRRCHEVMSLVMTLKDIRITVRVEEKVGMRVGEVLFFWARCDAIE